MILAVIAKYNEARHLLDAINTYASDMKNGKKYSAFVETQEPQISSFHNCLVATHDVGK